MRRLIGICLALILLVGCEPSPPDDLGTVLDDVPELPGTEKPYEMPELDRPFVEEKPGSEQAEDASETNRPTGKPANTGGLHR